jgi:membrane-bound serine protease (ClpP class)
LALVNNNNFDFSFTSGHSVLIALLRVVLPFVLALILFVSFGGRFFRSGMMKGFVLTHTQGNSTSFYDSNRSLQKLLNKRGKATSVLRPAGQVEIDSNRYDAMARDGYIEAGSDVEVVQISGAILVVKKTSSA